MKSAGEPATARSRPSRQARAPARAQTSSAAASSPSSGPNTACGARPDHGRLLGEDQLARVAEHLGVLEADRRQHDDRRAEHVGGVEAAAEAGLDRRRLDAGLGQGHEGRHGEHLELRDRAELARQPPASSRTRSTAAPRSAAATGLPATRTRSLKPVMCGDR